MPDDPEDVAGEVSRAVDKSVNASGNDGAWWARPTEWENYGDVNPEQHGGMFIRWEGNGWHVIETRKLGVDVPEDIGPPDATHVVFDYYFYPDDVFVGENPSNGLTDNMMRIVEALSDETLTLNYYEQNPEALPEGEVPEYAPEFKKNLPYYVVDLTFQIGEGRMDTAEDYWGYLRNKGIKEEDFRSGGGGSSSPSPSHGITAGQLLGEANAIIRDANATGDCDRLFSLFESASNINLMFVDLAEDGRADPDEVGAGTPIAEVGNAWVITRRKLRNHDCISSGEEKQAIEKDNVRMHLQNGRFDRARAEIKEITEDLTG